MNDNNKMTWRWKGGYNPHAISANNLRGAAALTSPLSIKLAATSNLKYPWYIPAGVLQTLPSQTHHYVVSDGKKVVIITAPHI